ncbi:undecaprenyl-diphosphatase UppP [Candidatus Kaiserbacteria bacterium RIFCSPLOWO2_01_FULL_53_17]|uniref:Undecaprenyl-diphosphatase n=1 Tax=Candidatus Kaiserbacteria bacterium RIFCSPLOWO2_01_FULL_53_17 TaxID=1798511 RepID=A0A1F6EGF4_9BACT|nr:MAG: undecaprenyl-diphosphatase UppP [Candidatus Kaiserbacteria bacterium RIFCSPLOWO2_01_FULL_53_17]
MSIFDVLILGIVEGFTEFLPISSTAHLIIVSELLRVPESAFLGSFIIAIQLGAIASVCLLYWKTILLDFETMKRVFVAFIPTALIGFALYKLVKGFLLENLMVVAWALLLGGIVLILFERWQKGISARATPLSTMPYTTALLIGCAQALAIIPGVSRAGATIVGGMALGLGRSDIVTFSFLLAIPTMLAATLYDLYKTGSSFATNEWHLLALGFAVSFIAAYAGVRFLVSFIQSHSFTAFGWYRIILGAIILVVLFF